MFKIELSGGPHDGIMKCFDHLPVAIKVISYRKGSFCYSELFDNVEDINVSIINVVIDYYHTAGGDQDGDCYLYKHVIDKRV